MLRLRVQWCCRTSTARVLRIVGSCVGLGDSQQLSACPLFALSLAFSTLLSPLVLKRGGAGGLTRTHLADGSNN